VVLTSGSTPEGMTKGMTRVAISHGQVPALEGCLWRLLPLMPARPAALTDFGSDSSRAPSQSGILFQLAGLGGRAEGSGSSAPLGRVYDRLGLCGWPTNAYPVQEALNALLRNRQELWIAGPA
jgi:hypothetical protein